MSEEDHARLEEHFDSHLTSVVGGLNERLPGIKDPFERQAEVISAKHRLYEVCFSQVITHAEKSSLEFGAVLRALRQVHGELFRTFPSVIRDMRPQYMSHLSEMYEEVARADKDSALLLEVTEMLEKKVADHEVEKEQLRGELELQKSQRKEKEKKRESPKREKKEGDHAMEEGGRNEMVQPTVDGGEAHERQRENEQSEGRRGEGRAESREEKSGFPYPNQSSQGRWMNQIEAHPYLEASQLDQLEHDDHSHHYRRDNQTHGRNGRGALTSEQLLSGTPTHFETLEKQSRFASPTTAIPDRSYRRFRSPGIDTYRAKLGAGQFAYERSITSTNKGKNGAISSSKRGDSASSSSSSQRQLSLKNLLDDIEAIYASKEKFDRMCRESQLPRETMEQHMASYLKQR